MSKGFNCACGKYHAFDAYVLAHYLIHTCRECGRKHTILNFEVIDGETDEQGDKVRGRSKKRDSAGR
jgi:hypothetical protein